MRGHFASFITSNNPPPINRMGNKLFNDDDVNPATPATLAAADP